MRRNNQILFLNAVTTQTLRTVKGLVGFPIELYLGRVVSRVKTESMKS